MREDKIPPLLEDLEYPDVRALLGSISARMRENLGETAVGLYLYGSLVAGDFDHRISDVDLLAATSRLIDEREFARLGRMHERLVEENPAWDDRVEIAYVPLAALRTFKTEKSTIANVSPGEPFHYLAAGDDWLLNWYFVRECGVTLFGPPPSEIIEPVSRPEYISAVRRQAAERGRTVEVARHSRPYQAYLIMTLCRAFCAVRNGEQVSKKRAAQVVREEFPEYGALIDSAFEWRASSRDENVDHEATYSAAEQFVLFIVGRISII